MTYLNILNKKLTILFVLLTIITILGCSTDNNEKPETSTQTSAKITKATPAPKKKTVNVVQSQPGPVFITDALNQTIKFDKSPEKIATISPTSTEMLYAAGASSILRDRASNFPEAALSLPDVGSAYNPSIETIIANKPDLVVIEALTQARFLPVLQQAGLKVMAVKAENIEDIKTGIRNLGIITKNQDSAEEKIAEIESRLAKVGNNDNRSVLILISDQDRNLYAARPESYTGLIATTLGLTNKAAGLPNSGPYQGFALMSPEAILGANPDFIITITPAPAPAPRLSDTIKRIPPFAALNAMRNNTIIEADVALFLQAPGPRIVEAVEFLKEKLGPQTISITDALNQTIKFDKSPEKIATISPTSTEMLYAAGASSILRDRASNFPEAALSLPDVGSAYNPSIETIIANKPDLVVIEALTQARFLPVLQQAGLKVMAVKAENIEDIKTGIRNLGIITKNQDSAEEKIAEIESRLAKVGNNDNRSVLILISDQDRNLYAARPESYTGLIATTLGLTNKAAGLPNSGPYQGFALMSPEAILGANPDFIITITPAPAPAPRLSDTIKRIPPFAALNAMRNNTIIEADVALFLQAPGPRIVEAVEFLKEKLN